MITNELAISLNYPGSWQNSYIHTPSFRSNDLIWKKCQKNMFPYMSNLNRFQFYKIGKTLGFQINRYLAYSSGILCYYQNKTDKYPKAYCSLQNLYFYYFKAGGHYVLHLTNTVDSISIFFNSNQFIKNYQAEIFCFVIQMNIKEKYQILQQIGEGTFSKVYAAINLNTKQKVALKIVPKINELQQTQTRHIVSQQKKILKFMDSKLVGKMEAFFQDNQSYIFVLQYLEGKDFNVYLKQKKQMQKNQINFILKQVLKSLVQIHQKNIIHRDIKPHNIIYNPLKGQVKLIDFGLSLMFNEYTQLSKYMRCGTMGYIAPEIANNMQMNRKRYDTKSDIFGFGIFAHMLLFGFNPLRGRSYRQTCERNIDGNVTLDQKLILQTYDQHCYNFLVSLLEKDPKKRPSAAQALNHTFLNLNYNDQIRKSITQDTKIMQNHLNDQVNQIQDKQFGGKNNVLPVSQKEILSPTKSLWKSRSKSFALA